MNATPAFSVVMPTYQRRDSLLRTLKMLTQVEYPADRLELVLVCDGCTDGSAEMARSLRLPFDVRVLEQSNQGPAAARNLALAHARGMFLLFLDDDVLPTRSLLTEHARAHGEAPEEDRVVIGPLLPPRTVHTPWVRWELDTVVAQYADMEAGRFCPGPRQFYTGNASVALSHVTDAGGFDVTFKRAEDVELAFRLQARGLHFVFKAAAAGLHMAERSFWSWLGGAYRYGRSDVVFGLDRGRPDVVGAVMGEFWDRNLLNRGLVRCALLAPGVGRALAVPAVGTAWLAHLAGRRDLSHAVCSALFSLMYWRGVRDELGETAVVRELIKLGFCSSEVDWAAVLEPSSSARQWARRGAQRAKAP